MKRYLYILLLGLICPLSIAQDVQRFAERGVLGTARYVGMGGAMTAIGGDPSAVKDNPAGLGLYRRSELSISMDEAIDRTQAAGTGMSYQRSQFAVPQASAVWAWGHPNKQRGMIYNNFMLSINRLTSYHRDIEVEGNAMGMLPTICLLTEGLAETFLQNLPWDDDEIGWLSILGYEGYMIDPVGDTKWSPAVEMTRGKLSISETGSADQYTLSWGANISNQWYVGVNLNVPTLAYTKRTTLYETDRIHSAELKSMFHVSGLGVNGGLGMIYRPIQSLRIGASFHTPTIMRLSMQTEGDMRSTVAGQSYEILTPASGVVEMELLSPWRTSVSVAGQIGSTALIAAQYDYAHSGNMDDVHRLRLGAEMQVYRGLFVNAGYVYESSFLQEEALIGLAYNSIRTDMDYRYTPYSQYISAGIGYRSNVVVAQVAYQYRTQLIHQYATEMQVAPMDVHTQTHRIVATLSWRI